MKIALLGYGKMGKTIERLARERGHEIVLIVDENNRTRCTDEQLKQADVAIEFTMPAVAVENYNWCFRNRVPVVSGTTGWLEKWDEVVTACERSGGTFFYASNYSIGVNIFFHLNRWLAQTMARFSNYKVSLEETHHIHKLDAPSGTAITLAEEILENIDRKDHWVKGTLQAPDGSVSGSAECAADEIPVSSIREGEVPGIHVIRYESEADSIILTHDAKNRKGFALGAVLAAEYTADKQGYLGMSDLFPFLK